MVEFAVTTPLPLSDSALKATGVKKIESLLNVGVPNSPANELSYVKSKLLPIKVTGAAIAVDAENILNKDIILKIDNLAVFTINP